jgi:beta-glucanase (GH16 family)/endonuclease YncB( thermonuclease family)
VRAGGLSWLPVSLLAVCLLASLAAAATLTQGGADSVRHAGHRAWAIKARITAVIDGKTIRARATHRKHKRSYVVRLIGIATPRPGKPVECGAREGISSLLALGFSHPRDVDGDGLLDKPGGRGRAVRLVTDPSLDRFDRSRRLLAYADLRRGPTLASAQLIRGWARVRKHGRRFARFETFRRAQSRARSSGRGVWKLCGGNFHRPLHNKPAPVPPEQPSPLAWSDEFNSAAGTLPDSANWTPRTGGRWSDGRELQCYTQRPENISHDGQGHLKITARYEPASTLCSDGPNDYTSARIDSSSKREFAYGAIAARIKLPGGVGTWPAFWMLGVSSPGFETWPAIGEVDILEARGPEPAKAHHALHGETNAGAHWQRSADTTGTDWTADWHVYGIRWSENRIEYQIDGVTRYTLTPADIPADAPWVFNKEFYLLLNMAVGDWGGTPDPADYPRELLVDWVRVYQPS